MPKQQIIAMACNWKLHTIRLWHAISMKLNIGKTITGLEIRTLNCKKIYYVTKLLEVMFKGELHCLHKDFYE